MVEHAGGAGDPGAGDVDGDVGWDGGVCDEAGAGVVRFMMCMRKRRINARCSGCIARGWLTIDFGEGLDEGDVGLAAEVEAVEVEFFVGCVGAVVGEAEADHE